MDEVCVLDVGTGNLGSLQRMLKKVGVESCRTADPRTLETARRLILPGVGAFDTGMQRLAEAGVLPVLEYLAHQRRIPILGICLGMQMLLDGSEEGQLPGLGWIPGRSARFDFPPGAAHKVPHMGWSRVTPQATDPLLEGMPAGARFYFAHSYHAAGVPTEYILAGAHHGYDFPCMIRCGNVRGAQFHPEKSHRFGLWLLARFCAL